MSEGKELRIARANEAIRTVDSYIRSIRSEKIRERLKEISSAIGSLRDAQYLFDSGEKELIRLYDRYLPYFMDILRQYAAIEVSGNYEAIQKHSAQLEKTLADMVDVIRSVIRILPQDEIDEANARAKAEELKAMLDAQRRSMVK